MDKLTATCSLSVRIPIRETATELSERGRLRGSLIRRQLGTLVSRTCTSCLTWMALVRVAPQRLRQHPRLHRQPDSNAFSYAD